MRSKMTWMEGCQLAAEYLLAMTGKQFTTEQIFNSHPSGELFGVIFFIEEAEEWNVAGRPPCTTPPPADATLYQLIWKRA